MFGNPYSGFPYANQKAFRMIPSGMATTNGINGIGRGIGSVSKPGFFKSLAGIKWGSVLNNTQKTLNVINQAIPVYYQIKPIWGNLKSFGKIMSVFNEPDNKENNSNINKINNTNNYQEDKKEESHNLPTFFIN